MTTKLASIREVAGGCFDYIVVGGGTAGCVVASRLSEDPTVSVVVLEAGPPHLNDPILDNPADFLQPMLDAEYGYQYSTITQPGLGGGQSMCLRGRGLGGTSSINWLMWTIPQRDEIEGITELGNDGWSWENFMKYQKKIQRFYTSPEDERSEFKNLYNPNSVGHYGPIPLIFSRDSSGAECFWQKSLEKHGVDVISTSLDGQVAGTYKNISNIDPTTGQRVSSANAYLVPALSRRNLKVLTDASVRKIITHESEEAIAASGVEFECKGNVYTVNCKKEVIVSAGAIKSPQILELSGIGDRKILEPLGVQVKVDLPSVGTNVQEHVSMGISRWKIKADSNVVNSGMLEDHQFAEKLRTSLGLPTPVTMVPNSVSFLPIQHASPRADALVRKQQAKFAQEADSLPLGVREQLQVQLRLLADPRVPDFEIIFFPFRVGFVPHPEPSKPYLHMFPLLGRPFSRGTIHIASADPKEDPAIDPHYYEEAIDLDIMVDAVKFIRKVAQTEPFASIVEAEEVPPPEVWASDKALYDYVRMNTSSSWHTCGSNSMLPREKGGVVDSTFKVYGTQNIRVVDLSVLPLQSAVHPQSIVYTLAEMASDIIRTSSPRAARL